MTRSTVGIIEAFASQVEALAGSGVRSQVMTGSESITAKTGAIEVAAWVQGAMNRLDEAAPPETAIAIMEACGAHCAAVNHAVIERAVARRRKYRSEEEYLAAEIRKPTAGTRLERRGDVLHQFYTPRSFGRGMRCFCALVQALPEGETLSPTYCHCSKALVKTLWEAVLGRPVTVQVLRSALTGADECEFTIEAEQP